MKKLMIAFVATVIAVGAQAATCTWVCNNIKDYTTGSNATGYAAYLFITEASGNALSYVEGASLTTIDSVVASIQAGTFTGAGAYKTATVGSSAAGAIPSALGINSFTAGDSLTAFTIILDGANIGAAQHYMIAQDANGNQTTTATWTSSSGAKLLSFGTQAGNTWNEIAPVPEPTSGLLMLLGMGALALRRRRA